MKKIFTFSLGLIAALCMSAQQQMPSANVINQVKNMQLLSQKQLSKTAIRYGTERKGLTPHTTILKEQEDTLMYMRPVGSFFGGYYTNFYSTYPAIIAPENAKQVSFNDISAYWTDKGYMRVWGLGEQPVDTAASLDMIEIFGEDWQAGYIYTMPTLYSMDTLSDPGYMIPTAAYQYGSAYPDDSYVWCSPEDEEGNPVAMPMTTCAMYTDVAWNEDGWDCYCLDGQKYGEYAYGSNLNIQSALKSQTPVIIDTFGVWFDNLTSMVVDTAYLPIYNFGAKTIADMIPSGATITLNIYPVTINQQYQLIIGNELLASATATQNDVLSFEAGQSDEYASVGILPFVFEEKDPFGGKEPTPIQLDGMFYCEISGISSNGCDFGIMADMYYCMLGGETQSYITFNGKRAKWWYSNMALTLNAYFTDGSPSALNSIKNQTDNKCIKYIMPNGTLCIYKNNKIYNVLGVEL